MYGIYIYILHPWTVIFWAAWHAKYENMFVDVCGIWLESAACGALGRSPPPKAAHNMETSHDLCRKSNHANIYTLYWCMNLHVRSMCCQLKYIRHYKLVAFAKAEKTNQTQPHKAPAKGNSWSSARGVWQPVLSWWGWLTKNHVWI